GARLLDLAWPGQSCGLGSSLSDLLGGLPARALPARRVDGAGPAWGVRGCRVLGGPARERGAAPPVSRVRYQPAGRLWLATLVPADPPQPVGRGARGDPGDAAGRGTGDWSPANGTTPAGGDPAGRPSTAAAISKLVIRIATDIPTWGRRRVQSSS